MENIRFINDETESIYKVSLTNLSDERILICFEDKPNDISIFNDGFVVLNEHNGIIQANYSSMKYIYKDCNDDLTYILTTKEDDKYVEPVIPDTPEFEPYIPNLQETISSKVRELSNNCNQRIVDGVDVQIDGQSEHFSYKDEDQVNIKELFDLAAQTKVPLYYHADGMSCKLYTVEQIVSIYSSNAINKMHHITYFNQLKLYVESLDDKEKVSSVSYGDELTGTYLDTYNNAMAQANIGLTTLLGAES